MTILHSLGGQVCLWDIRLAEPIKTLQAHQGGLTHMTVHEHAPIFATCVSFPLSSLLSLDSLPEGFCSSSKNAQIRFQRRQAVEHERPRRTLLQVPQQRCALPSSFLPLSFRSSYLPLSPSFPPRSRSPLVQQAVNNDPHGLPPSPHGPRLLVGRRRCSTGRRWRGGRGGRSGSCWPCQRFPDAGLPKGVELGASACPLVLPASTASSLGRRAVVVEHVHRATDETFLSAGLDDAQLLLVPLIHAVAHCRTYRNRPPAYLSPSFSLFPPVMLFLSHPLDKCNSCRVSLSSCCWENKDAAALLAAARRRGEGRIRLDSVSSLRRLFCLLRRLPIHIKQLRTGLLRRYPQLPRDQPLQPRIRVPTLIDILELPPLCRLRKELLVRLLKKVDRGPHKGVLAREFGGVRLATLAGVELPGSGDGFVDFGGGDDFGEGGETLSLRWLVLVQCLFVA